MESTTISEELPEGQDGASVQPAAEAPAASEPVAGPGPIPVPVVEPEPEPELAPSPSPSPAPVPVPQPSVEPEAPAFAVGPSLRSAREKKGKTITECAQHLCIRQSYLEALETGRHGDLPGGTYAQGFLRTYAEFLGLDGDELVRRFRQEGAGGFTNRTQLAFPSPVSEGRIPGGAVIFLGMILAAVAYGGWYLLSTRESTVAEIVPPLPDRLSSMLNRQAALTGDTKGIPAVGEEKAKEDVVPPPEGDDDKSSAQVAVPAEPAPAEPVQPVAPIVAPVETASVKPAEVKIEAAKPVAPKIESVKVEAPKVEAPKVEAPKLEPAKVETPKVEASKVEPAKVEVSKTETPKVEAAAAGEGKVFGTEHADSRVVIKATADDCWVQVREMDGSLLMSRLLRRGDSYRVPNRPGLNLMVGNAGSLEVSVDGRKAPALGSVGQVRRDIRLDPDKLLGGG